MLLVSRQESQRCAQAAETLLYPLFGTRRLYCASLPSGIKLFFSLGYAKKIHNLPQFLLEGEGCIYNYGPKLQKQKDQKDQLYLAVGRQQCVKRFRADIHLPPLPVTFKYGSMTKIKTYIKRELKTYKKMKNTTRKRKLIPIYSSQNFKVLYVFCCKLEFYPRTFKFFIQKRTPKAQQAKDLNLLSVQR